MQTETRAEPITPVSILLVDDRPENLISLAAVLDRPDYRLVKAGSGPEALRSLMDDDFALILLDVQMPGMDGFETASLIKKRERSKNIPIIFITALSTDEPFLFKGYDAGAVDYIMKPFEPSVLRSKVAVFADLHRKTLQLRAQTEVMRRNERLEREREISRLEVLSLREREAANRRYRDLVDDIQDGVVWTADPTSLQLTFVSHPIERILGLSVDHLLAEPKQWADLIHPEDREIVTEQIVGLTRAEGDSPRDLRFEHRCLTRGGETIWFQTGVRLAETEIPGKLELRGLSVDVTPIKQAEQAARKAVKARDEFLSIASHELKTPLTPLSLQLQVLRRLTNRKVSEQEILDKLSRTLDVSCKQVDRLARLVDELLDVSRINNGRLELEVEEVELGELIREVSARFSEELKRVGCPLKIEVESTISGRWDRLRVEQVFINLLTNAAKYGAGKLIIVRARCDGEMAVFEVEDQGIGIARQDQARIFDQYERAVPAANFGGLGLGLYIVHQIIDAHGGRIEVQSEKGSGSTFRVGLPLTPGKGLTVKGNGAAIDGRPSEAADIIH